MNEWMNESKKWNYMMAQVRLSCSLVCPRAHPGTQQGHNTHIPNNHSQGFRGTLLSISVWILAPWHIPTIPVGKLRTRKRRWPELPGLSFHSQVPALPGVQPCTPNPSRHPVPAQLGHDGLLPDEHLRERLTLPGQTPPLSEWLGHPSCGLATLGHRGSPGQWPLH